MTIDFGDGVSALERVMRSITMAADGAIQRLVGLGWKRDLIDIELPDDPIPCWVTLRGKRIYEITLTRHDDDRISIHGEWLVEPTAPVAPEPVVPKRGIISRILGR